MDHVEIANCKKANEKIHWNSSQIIKSLGEFLIIALESKLNHIGFTQVCSLAI